MQKKLYFLDDQEKNRILNLHENRTQSQYLVNEQETNIVSPDVAIITLESLMKNYKGKLVQFFKDFPTTYKDTYNALPEKTKETLVTWSKIPCVTNSVNVTPTFLGDKTIVFDGGGFYWYGNMRKMNKQTKEMVSFYCSSDGKAVDGTPQGAPNPVQIPTMGKVLPGVFTPEKLQQIRTTIGSKETGTTLSQTDINNLYTTLFNQLPKK